MQDNDLLEQLKHYFDTTPEDVIKKEWEERKYLNDIGPDAVEWATHWLNIRKEKDKIDKMFEELIKDVDEMDDEASEKCLQELKKWEDVGPSVQEYYKLLKKQKNE